MIVNQQKVKPRARSTSEEKKQQNSKKIVPAHEPKRAETPDRRQVANTEEKKQLFKRP